MSLKGSRAIAGKTRKNPQIKKRNYDCNDIKMALYSKQEIYTAKLDQAKATHDTTISIKRHQRNNQ